MSQINIGTHNGSFHADESLACCMLINYTKQFKGAKVIRTRDLELLKTCDIVVDVGGIYDPSKHLYDHHQKSFQDTYNEKSKIRLSSAGLVFKHFGKEIVKNCIDEILNEKQYDIEKKVFEPQELEIIQEKLYVNFVKYVDAVDNGIEQYNKEVIQFKNYVDKTGFASRISRLHPLKCELGETFDSRFPDAIELAKDEFKQQLKGIILSWFPAKTVVERSIKNRFNFYSTGQIVYLEKSCAWKEHLYDIEKEQKIEEQLKFVIFKDETNNEYRIQAVSKSIESFESRIPLKKEWRGIQDKSKLELVSGIPDIVFCHISGFIGGAKSLQSTIKMGELTLQAYEIEQKNNTEEKK